MISYYRLTLSITHEILMRVLSGSQVGYPNVGKSSTLNALLGRKLVPVSATPGKTKRLQTHFVPSARYAHDSRPDSAATDTPTEDDDAAAHESDLSSEAEAESGPEAESEGHGGSDAEQKQDVNANDEETARAEAERPPHDDRAPKPEPETEPVPDTSSKEPDVEAESQSGVGSAGGGRKLLLCDCPGLVMPALAPSRAHLVAFGVLPIDHCRDLDTPAQLVHTCTDTFT